MLKDEIIYTIADAKNAPYARLLEKSLHHFHPEVEFRIYEENKGVPDFFYKATPFIAKDLLREYELVIKIDADSIVTGPLDDVFNDTSYDFGVVLNNNRCEPTINCLNVSPVTYANCGFVAMRSRDAVNHWWRLCNRGYFNQFQMREQDLLNIMIYYGDYNVRCFDMENEWYGLRSKSEWPRFEVKHNKLFCPSDPTYNPVQKEIRCIHAGGGNVEKWNWPKQFSPEVVEYLKEITK